MTLEGWRVCRSVNQMKAIQYLYFVKVVFFVSYIPQGESVSIYLASLTT